MIRRSLVLLFLPLAAFADDPFACVDPDVLDAFVGDWYSSAQYSTELPTEAASLAVFPQFELVGSMTAGSDTKIVYKTSQEPGAALVSSIALLEGAGWKDRGSEYGFVRGFQSASAPQLAHLCHRPEAQSLEILTKERSGHTLLLFSLRQEQDWRTCRGSMARLSPSLQDYLPNLQAPDDAEVHESGSSGGGDEYSADAVVSTALSRADLLQHFDEQIRTQGWVADSDWSGSTTVGTVWTRRGSKDQLLVGTMRLAEAGQGLYSARFTIISVAPGDYHSGHSSVSGPASLH